ncbi:hypothetical protein [Candidatus Phytoplasma sp. AldY-WA1]|uniref:hypothetical protein n=1 Tax=Candidatus Phytoplasma sp. AldY-WA1 TaxID=2852100 RepID=UPI002551B97F|nr:hypothetical protein [Candidatus Phytoplasma sp. AldY-WA1]
MGNNFFKKLVLFIIPLCAIAAIIWFCKYKNNPTKNIEPSSSFDLESKSENTKESEKDNEDKTKENNEEKKEYETIVEYEPKNEKLINEESRETKIENLPKKDIQKIELPTDNLDLREAINKYKIENQLNNYGGEYEEKIERKTIELDKIELNWNNLKLTNIFETEDKIYHIICENNNEFKQYKDQLIEWMNQCPIKKGKKCPPISEIKDKFKTKNRSLIKKLKKLFGKGEKDITVFYDEEGNECYFEYKSSDLITYVMGVSTIELSEELLPNHYYNTTKPPEKPSKLDLNVNFKN